jgi:release factor glutamine methyltransferase
VKADRDRQGEATTKPDLLATMPHDSVAPGIAVGQARRALARRFRAAGLETPELDSRVLLQTLLDVDHTGLIAAAGAPLGAAAARRINAAARRRIGGEPIARIVGWKEFWGLRIQLGPATLVPRPESETVVVAALSAVDAGGSRDRPLAIADLGTGSGALVLALLSELPHAFGIGTDVDPAALAIARSNADRLGFAARVRFVACEFGAALAGGFDLVVSNPPYVQSGDIATLAVEVRDHDPRIALDGGPDGLACYRVVAGDAARLVGPRGQIVVELGAGAADDVAALFSAAGLRPAPPDSDPAGTARALRMAHAECV